MRRRIRLRYLRFLRHHRHDRYQQIWADRLNRDLQRSAESLRGGPVAAQRTF